MTVFPDRPPASESPRPWTLPPHALQDLGNGLRVAAVRIEGLPIVQVRWVFGSGRIHERSDRLGSALLLQRAMRHGMVDLSTGAPAAEGLRDGDELQLGDPASPLPLAVSFRAVPEGDSGTIMTVLGDHRGRGRVPIS